RRPRPCGGSRVDRWCWHRSGRDQTYGSMIRGAPPGPTSGTCQVGRERPGPTLGDRQPDELDPGPGRDRAHELPRRRQLGARADRVEQDLVRAAQLVPAREVVELPAAALPDAPTDPYLWPRSPTWLEPEQALPEQVHGAGDRDGRELEDADRRRGGPELGVDRPPRCALGCALDPGAGAGPRPARRGEQAIELGGVLGPGLARA